MKKLTLLFVLALPGVFACSPPGASPKQPGGPVRPAAPSNLHVVIVGSDNVLTWDPVPGAASYGVYYSTDGVSYGTTPVTVAVAQYLLPRYGSYEVSARNAAGEGPHSTAVNHPLPTGPVVATPIFAPGAGSFETVQDIVISTATAGASVYYTLDGSTPSIGVSPQYATPIHISAGHTVTVTAIAAKAGFANSDGAVGVFHVKTWSVVGSAGFSGGGVDYVALALDGSGVPYVAYTDSSTSPSSRATVMKLNCSSWTALGGAGLSPGAAPWTSISIDTSGTVRVSYKDNTASGKATVRTYSGGSWTTEGSPGFSAGTFIYSSLATYSSGSTHTLMSHTRTERMETGRR